MIHYSKRQRTITLHQLLNKIYQTFSITQSVQIILRVISEISIIKMERAAGLAWNSNKMILKEWYVGRGKKWRNGMRQTLLKKRHYRICGGPLKASVLFNGPRASTHGPAQEKLNKLMGRDRCHEPVTHAILNTHASFMILFRFLELIWWNCM